MYIYIKRKYSKKNTNTGIGQSFPHGQGSVQWRVFLYPLPFVRFRMAMPFGLYHVGSPVRWTIVLGFTKDTFFYQKVRFFLY